VRKLFTASGARELLFPSLVHGVLTSFLEPENIIDYYFSSVTTAAQGPWMTLLTLIPLTGKTMKPFLKRLAGGCRSFRDLGMGETAALSHSASSSWPRGLSKGNAEPRFFEAGRKQVAEKTSP
jgi:hypothetical protein